MATPPIVRPVNERDLEAILSWWRNPAVMGAVRAERLRVTIDDLCNEYLPRWINAGDRDFHQFIVEQNGQPVGEVGYQVVGENPRTARISLKIGEPELWGHGLGTEATRWMCNYLFTIKEADAIEADPGDWNERSLRILRGLGFSEVERVPFPATAIHDAGISVRMRLTRAEWVAGRSTNG